MNLILLKSLAFSIVLIDSKIYFSLSTNGRLSWGHSKSQFLFAKTCWILQLKANLKYQCQKSLSISFQKYVSTISFHRRNLENDNYASTHSRKLFSIRRPQMRESTTIK